MTDVLDPAALGYYERSPGSGVWYHPGRSTNSFSPGVCENPECPLPGGRFMARRLSGNGRFCSLSCRNWKELPSYYGRHARVVRVRGSASEYACVDCGKPAVDWAQIHGTDGTDPHEHYQPRCRFCHRVYDTDQASRGEDHYLARRSDEEVAAIVAEYKSGGITISALARKRGVGRKALSNWIHGKTRANPGDDGQGAADGDITGTCPAI